MSAGSGGKLFLRNTLAPAMCLEAQKLPEQEPMARKSKGLDQPWTKSDSYRDLLHWPFGGSLFPLHELPECKDLSSANVPKYLETSFPNMLVSMTKGKVLRPRVDFQSSAITSWQLKLGEVASTRCSCNKVAYTGNVEEGSFGLRKMRWQMKTGVQPWVWSKRLPNALQTAVKLPKMPGVRSFRESKDVLHR